MPILASASFFSKFDASGKLHRTPALKTGRSTNIAVYEYPDSKAPGMLHVSHTNADIFGLFYINVAFGGISFV